MDKQAAFDALQIRMAAQGCVSGTLSEWPALNAALKRRGHDLPMNTPAADLRRISQLLETRTGETTVTARMPAVTATKPVQPKNEPQGMQVPLDPILAVALDNINNSNRAISAEVQVKHLRELNRELVEGLRALCMIDEIINNRASENKIIAEQTWKNHCSTLTMAQYVLAKAEEFNAAK